MAKRKRSGLGGVATSTQGLKYQVKECGSHYFDKDTMRFFNSRLINVYPAHKKGVTYFTESKGGGRWGGIPRHYTVGVFKNCRVESLGKGYGAHGRGKGAYSTSRQAAKVAKAIRAKVEGGGATLKRKRRRSR